MRTYFRGKNRFWGRVHFKCNINAYYVTIHSRPLLKESSCIAVPKKWL